MGLDAVELLLAIEEEFAIDIPNAVAERLTTPRRVAEYIYGLQAGVSRRCHSMLAFHRVRSVLMQEAGVPRAAVRLDTPLSSLFRPGRPFVQWEAVWTALACGSPPELAFSNRRVWQVALVACSITLCMLILVTAVEWGNWSAVGTVLIGAWLVALSQTPRLAAAYADRIPAHLDSVRYLVGQVNIPVVADEESTGFKLILARVIAVAAIQTCRDEEDIHPDQRFVEDLRID